jgi:hypothetical protein
MDICRTDDPPLRAVPGDGPHVSACWLPTDRAAREAARVELATRTLAGRTL